MLFEVLHFEAFFKFKGEPKSLGCCGVASLDWLRRWFSWFVWFVGLPD